MNTAHYLVLVLSIGCSMIGIGANAYNKRRVGGPHVAFDLIAFMYFALALTLAVMVAVTL